MLRRFGTNLFFVPKPGPKDRKKIIELHAKDLNGVSKIKMHEINVLADLCAGMSASDIGIILQSFQLCLHEMIMSYFLPASACIAAKKGHIYEAQESEYFSKNKDGFYVPTTKSDPNAEKLQCEEIESGMLASKPVTFNAIKTAIEETPRNYESEDMKTLKFAMDQKIKINSMVAMNKEKTFVSKFIGL